MWKALPLLSAGCAASRVSPPLLPGLAGVNGTRASVVGMPLRCSSDSTARRSLSASMAARSLVASVPTAGGPPANRVASRMQGSTSLLAGMSMTPFSQLTQTCHVSAAGLPSRPTSTTPGAAGAALTSTPAPDTCVANDVLLQVGQAARDDFGLPISSTGL